MTVPPAPNAIDDASVAVNVIELLTVNDFSFAIVNVALEDGFVSVILFMVVTSVLVPTNCGIVTSYSPEKVKAPCNSHD